MVIVPTEPAEPAVELYETAGTFTPGEQLLRFSTAGSVDDGKSTLIGRLLYDSKSVLEDQLASVKKSTINRSGRPIDFSLLTDGLRAEREQGITIDVAYRYFATPRRKFIIADTPGHEQYTRNMATGASTADAAIVLIDASKGVLRQSRRHAYIATLLGVQHIIAAVNKMDLVDYSREVFERIADEFRLLTDQLGVQSVYAVPVSALEGDNVVRRSLRMPWFEGPALLEYLETLPVANLANSGPLRFPVQYVVRPDSTFRGFAGQVASGELRPGMKIVALPSGLKTRVKSLVSFDGDLEQAGPGSAVNITLEDEIDLSRGDLVTTADHLPSVEKDFRAMVVWMHADRLDFHKDYLLKHTTRTVKARVKHVRHRVDVNTLENGPAARLEMNDIAAVDIRTALPLYFDPYRTNRVMGSFILIDPITNATVAAGIIQGGPEQRHSSKAAAAESRGRISKEERRTRFGHPPAAVWLGGRQRVADLVERALFEEGWQVKLAGLADFHPNELPTVAKAFHMAGIVAIFCSGENEVTNMQSVRAVFSSEAFFALEEEIERDETAAASIVERLHRWREQRSYSSGD
jgi:bifunctional enzyme CysN/CysC/sulfate adenylyltransferase subunit 1